MFVAVMQPYFFPYIGYFRLIHRADLFLVYDTAQFPKQGWVNRNRIMSKTSDWEFITVPLEKSSFVDSYRTPISKIKTSRTLNWKDKIRGQLRQFEKNAPHAKEVLGLVSKVFSSDNRSISHLDVKGLEASCDHLGIESDFRYVSEMSFDFPDAMSREQKLLQMCREVGATTYVNLPGGVELYDHNMFARYEIELEIIDVPEFRYKTSGFEWQDRMSILDVMLWNDAKQIKSYLNTAWT